MITDVVRTTLWRTFFTVFKWLPSNMLVQRVAAKTALRLSGKSIEAVIVQRF